MKATELGPLLTLKEAAARAHVSPDYMGTCALRGELQSIKIGTAPGKRGGRRLFPQVEVDAWLARKLRAA